MKSCYGWWRTLRHFRPQSGQRFSATSRRQVSHQYGRRASPHELHSTPVFVTLHEHCLLSIATSSPSLIIPLLSRSGKVEPFKVLIPVILVVVVGNNPGFIENDAERLLFNKVLNPYRMRAVQPHLERAAQKLFFSPDG